jgi:ADP-ribosylglycohydrolase
LEETFQIATDVGKVTHVDPRCVVSCCLVTALVRGIIRGEVASEADLDALIETSFAWVDGSDELRNPTRTSDNEGSATMEDPGESVESTLKGEEYRKYCYTKTLRELELDDKTMGYVFKCLGSAVLTLRLAIKEGPGLDSNSTRLFETLIANLIMEGGDADTNACVAGALVGAWVGYSRLPAHWSNGMRNSEWLVAKAETVSLKVGIMDPSPKARVKIGSEDPDTALDGSKGLLSKEQLEKMEKDFVLKILLMQKARREKKEAADSAAKKGTGVGKWFR